jgi:type IV pilus assembly protein PilC
MSSYRFAAKDQSGRTIEDVIQAQDEVSAVAELRRRNLVVLKVDEVGAAPRAARGVSSGFSMFKARPSATRQELVMFTRQLATMVGSGIAILEAIDVLTEQAETKGFKLTCQVLGQELRAGNDLSSAMQGCRGVFSPLYVSMVSAGEVSGQMDVILERLADYLEASEHLRREIKSALTYPVISLVLVLAITAFLMLGVVPTFRQIFDSMEIDLPKITRMVLGTSDWLRANWYVAFGGTAVAAFGAWALLRTETGQLAKDRLSLKAPVFGQIVRKVALARFSRTFATLVRSGVPIMGTLDIVADTAGNRVVASAVHASKESVRNGNMLSEPLAKSPVFPPMVVRMIAIGERSGALENLLEKIAEFYDAQVKATIKSLTSLIEPLLITLMGVLVGGVVMAVFLPILDLVGQLSSAK